MQVSGLYFPNILIDSQLFRSYRPFVTASTVLSPQYLYDWSAFSFSFDKEIPSLSISWFQLPVLIYIRLLPNRTLQSTRSVYKITAEMRTLPKCLYQFISSQSSSPSCPYHRKRWRPHLLATKSLQAVTHGITYNPNPK